MTEKITSEHADALFRAICNPSLIHSDASVTGLLAELLRICRAQAGEPTTRELFARLNAISQ